MKNILVEADITEEFGRDVPIYDLNQLLNCLSLIPGAEVQLGDHSITITDGTNSVDYRYADPSVINSPPDKELSLPSKDVCIVLNEEHLDAAKKASAVLQVPDVSVVGDGSEIKLVVGDKKNSGSNAYSVVVGETDKVFTFFFKTENLKMLPGDYDVTISSKNLSQFVSHSRPVTYWVAVEPDSSYNE